MWQSMFQLPLPVLEKILRPILVYLCLVILLRLFGKRELAQLNPFDLVVLLSLSNTVQNAIIGNDNSVSGGLIGALSLLSVNWLLNRGLFRAPKLDAMLQGGSTVLIRHGRMDHQAMDREILTEKELIGVLHRQGVHAPDEVKLCVLEPSGNFYIERLEDRVPAAQFDALMQKMDTLHAEVQSLQQQLKTQG